MSEQESRAARVAVVTGAGTGIGRAIAVKLGGLGWRVAIGGRRVDRLAETVALVEEAGGACFAHPHDVTDPESAERFFLRVEEGLGNVTVLINNAGVGRWGPLEEFSPAEIHAEIATKLTGALYMARLGIQSMRRHRAGGDSAPATWSSGSPRAASASQRARRSSRPARR